MKRLIVTGMGIALCFSASAVERYVDLNNPAPVAPYTDWTSAAPDIQSAVDAASAGDVIWVTNGTYYLTSQISVSKAVTIQSVNGPEVTVVDAQQYGRVFNLTASGVVLDGLTVMNGYASGNGGGIYCSSSATITNCVISGNNATGSGGGVYGSASFSDCTISDNTAAGGSGGGLYSGNAANCFIANNSASQSGGGLYGGSATLCVISNNSSTTASSSYGGGGARDSMLRRCEIIGNSAGYYGGGIRGGSADNCLIINNRTTTTSTSSSYGGGGSFFATLRNCTVCDNTSSAYGGGVHDGTIYNSIIYYNSGYSSYDNAYDSADYGSCGTGLDSGNGNISSAPQFVNRTADDYRLALGSPCIDSGVGVYVTSSEDLDGNPRILNSIVDMGAYEYVWKPMIDLSMSSIAVSVPFGAESVERSFTVSNSGVSNLVYEISTNAAWLSVSPVSGISAGEADLITVNMDLSSLSNGTHTGTITVSADGSENSPRTVAVQVTIVPPSIQLSTSSLNAQTPKGESPSDQTFTVRNAGNTNAMSYTVSDDANWLSASPVSGTSAGETDTITISYDTASLSGGSYTGLITVAVADADNSPQTVRVSLTVIPPNITLSTSQLSVSVMTGQDPVDQTFTVRNAGNTSAMSYTVSDDAAWLSVSPASGVSTGETDTVTVSYNTASMAGGSYSGLVTVASTAAENSPETIEVLLTLIPNTIYVSAEAGSDANSGFSWDDAKATIQAGVDALEVSGGTVLVSNGVYGLTGEITVNKALTIESVNGPEVTVVDAQRYGRCFNLGSYAITLSGFTCTNGYSESNGGGIYCPSTVPVITNCIISGNWAMSSGGGMYYGTANNCIIKANSASSSGGGLYQGAAENCLIVENSYGGGMYYGTARNCTISGNIGTYQMRYGTAYNSIIYGGNYGVSMYGCYTSDPLFVDEANGNYHLTAESSCVDAGINLYVNSETDLDGNPRIQNGLVDIGAYEYVPGSTPNLSSVIYVSNGTGNDTNSGASWAEAKATIQAGVDSVISGGTVLVSNGTYYLTSDVAVETPLTLQSVSGPYETVIDAQYYSRCLTISADSVSVEGVTLQNGFSPDWERGGAVYSSGADTVLRSCVIADNVSWDDGGGVYFGTDDGQLESCTVRDNESFFADGGGAVVHSVSNCLFEGNSASSDMGGLYAEQAFRSTFRDNEAGSNYGGGCIREASGCLFEGNFAAGNVGGLVCESASGCLVVSNSAFDSVGGVAGNITSCTIVGNQAGSTGGLQGEARNSIIFGNTPDNLQEGSMILFSCAPELEHGTLGNITNSPAFVDMNVGDYRLSTLSPCVDLGANAYSPGVADLDNNPRVANSRIDMGAYEYQAAVVDTDGDEIGDFAESQYGTDPNNPDSDGDGFSDGWEISKGWNPNEYNADIVSYIDSNPSIFGGFTEEDIGDLAFGQVMLGVSNSMVNLTLDIMQSDDLINWTNVGQAVQWSIPETNKAFFRFRAQP